MRINKLIRMRAAMDNRTPNSNDSSTDEVSKQAKPIFSASQLKSTPPKTPEQIKILVKSGRFSEISPHQAGYDEEK